MSSYAPQLSFSNSKWTKCLIGNIADVGSSKRIHESEWTTEGIPFVRARDIVSAATNNKNLSPEIFISKETYLQTDKKGSIKKGDVLITGVGTIGVPYLVKHDDLFYYKDGNVLKIRCNELVSADFLYYYISSNIFQKHLKSIAATGTVATFTINNAISSPIKFPEIKEQQKIAEFFTALDEKIRIKRAHIMQTEKLKTYVMKQVFSGQMRFGYKVKWTEKKFKDVLDIERGSSPRPISKYLCDSEDGLNWIKIGDAPIKGNRITSVKEKILPSGLKQSRMVHKGELLLSNSMSFGRPYILEVDGCIHDGWLVIRNHNNIFNLDFLVYLLASDEVKKQYKKLAGHGVVSNLNKDLVSEVILRYPPLNEQNTIAQMLNSVDNKIALQKNQLESLEKLKKAFMQRMFV